MFRYIFFGVLLLAACNSSNPKNQFIIPDKNDINEIIKVIIVQDCVPNDNIPLCIDLEKIKIYASKSDLNLPPPPHVYTINIKDLINSSYNQVYFSKADSSYLLFQNDKLKSFRIEHIPIPHAKTTTQAIEDHNRNSDGYYARYIQLSIPIFSADQQSAYVLFDRYCPLCGSGRTIFLKKIKGTWKIVTQVSTWES